jgi:hypothetical protein
MFAVGCAPHHVRKLFSGDILPQVGRGLGLNRLKELVVVRVGGEDDDTYVGYQLPDTAGQLEPVVAGGIDVHDDHIRQQAFQLRQYSLIDVIGAGDLDFAAFGQRVRHPLPEDGL